MDRNLLVFGTSLLTFTLSACYLLDDSAQSKAADYAVKNRLVIQAISAEQAHTTFKIVVP